MPSCGSGYAHSQSARRSSGGIFDLPALEQRAAALNEQAAAPNFWNDSEKAQTVSRESAQIAATIDRCHRLEAAVDEARVFLELAEEGDAEARRELFATIERAEADIERAELERLLGGEHDAGDAIVEIHPGAGGLEAQDWAEMLLRMYLRWCERRGFRAELVEQQPGEGAGIKSATLTVAGSHAYGYLRGEAGIHRLVRISPFDANARRHTSFASVFVFPDLDEDIEVDIRDDDLRIDTYRSSGAGGQHVNKTDSAVRITHLPSGIVVACQNERSQHKNKSRAMKTLRSRLYDLEKRRQEERMAELTQGKTDIGFGHQIRSYVLHPYRLVKDHRTNLEIGNADGVLDGALDPLIEACLRWRAAHSGSGPSR